MTLNIATEMNTETMLCDSKSLIKGLKRLKPMLKSLYCLISSYLSYNAAGDGPSARPAENGLNIKFNTVALSSILLEELRDRLSNISPLTLDQDDQHAVPHVSERDSAEELLLLTRCCVLMVRLHSHDVILMEKLLDAVALQGLLPFQYALDKTKKGCCTTLSYTDLGAKSFASYSHLSKQMVEVFLDEMFADGLLRESIATLDYFSSERRQSEFSSIHIEALLDGIAAHFLLSVYGEQSLTNFAQSFVWMEKQILCVPELSLTTAISLVKHPVVSSSVLLHAHLISLVSEVIGISSFQAGPNIRSTEIYLSAFHDSVILYCGHLSKLLPDFCSNPSEQQTTVHRHFKQFHCHSDSYDKVNFVLADWESSWKAHICNMLTESISNLASDAISYIKMIVNLFGESRKENMLLFLSSLVKVISTEVDEVLLHRIKELTMEDFCLLASILKLMSCSMLQTMYCLEESCSKSSSKIKEVFPGWQSLLGFMICFRQFNLHLPIRTEQFMVDALKSHLSTYEDTNMIFMHFSGLLSLCTATGLDFLVKACLFMMMAVMKVLSFEESILESLRSSENSEPDTKTHAFPPTNATRVATSTSHKRLPSPLSPLLPAGSQSGLVLPYPASKLKSVSLRWRVELEKESCAHSLSRRAGMFKSQTKSMGKQSTTCLYSEPRELHNWRRPYGENVSSIGECHAQQTSCRRVASAFQRIRSLSGEPARTTDGRPFLESVTDDRDLIDEFADFIECKGGKNYTDYIENRGKLRYMKGTKNARRQLEKKKKVFSNIMGSGSWRSYERL